MWALWTRARILSHVKGHVECGSKDKVFEFWVQLRVRNLTWERVRVSRAPHDPLTFTSLNSKPQSIAQLIRLTYAGYSINVGRTHNRCHFPIRTTWDLHVKILKQSPPEQPQLLPMPFFFCFAFFDFILGKHNFRCNSYFEHVSVYFYSSHFKIN